MSCRLPPWNLESLKKNIFYVTTYDQYSNYTWVTLAAHIPWIVQFKKWKEAPTKHRTQKNSHLFFMKRVFHIVTIHR